MAGRVTQKGFTIVETMLVLGISGMMLAGIMASVGAGIASQRYKDAANATVDYLQGQYNLTSNTRNDRRHEESYCSTSGLSATPRTEFRATGECTIVGRMIRGNGSEIVSLPLYATVDPESLRGESNPLEALKKSKLVEDTTKSEPYTLEWGTRLFPAGNKAVSQTFSIAIIRSPFTGIINTFIDTTNATSTIDQLLSRQSALNEDALFCLDSSGGMANMASSTLGVKVVANSTNATGVTLVGDGGGC